jgi:peroxidase
MTMSLRARRFSRVARVKYRPKVSLLEGRCLLSASSAIESIDDTGNNPINAAWGSAGIDLIRIAAAAYADGLIAPAGGNRPSARVISNTVADQGNQDILSQRDLSAMIYAWGQFLDHDIDLTPDASPAQAFNILVPKGDPSFESPTNPPTIALTRGETSLTNVNLGVATGQQVLRDRRHFRK